MRIGLSAAFLAGEPFATGQYGQALDTGVGQTL